MTYSVDLRERAVQYVREGGRQSEACRIFGISSSTLYRLLRMEDLTPKRERRRFVRKLDGEALAAHVRAYPDATLAERAAHFRVRINAIWYRLRQMRITKKNDEIPGAMSGIKDGFSSHVTRMDHEAGQQGRGLCGRKRL
jgi:transposase-like protein